MSGIVWLIFTYSAFIIMIAVTAYKIIAMFKLPEHLRWELAPVPHEKGRSRYGGSYLEEYEWWNKPRKTSFINSVVYMAKEIFLLKGVWENNRTLWPYSFSFHTGIYFVVFMAFFLFISSLLQLANASYFLIHVSIVCASLFAYAGYLIGAFGTIGLIIKRATDDKMKNFNTPSTYFNLLFLFSIFASGIVSILLSNDFFMETSDYILSLITADRGISVSFPLSMHYILALLFMIYLPFTYMIHFIAKYFFYHDIRWNDEPANSKSEEKILKLLNQKVSWAGPHIRGDGKKTWIDIANEEMKDDKKD